VQPLGSIRRARDHRPSIAVRAINQDDESPFGGWRVSNVLDATALFDLRGSREYRDLPQPRALASHRSPRRRSRVPGHGTDPRASGPRQVRFRAGPSSLSRRLPSTGDPSERSRGWSEANSPIFIRVAALLSWIASRSIVNGSPLSKPSRSLVTDAYSFHQLPVLRGGERRRFVPGHGSSPQPATEKLSGAGRWLGV
jgi:hypothetical protein